VTRRTPILFLRRALDALRIRLAVRRTRVTPDEFDREHGVRTRVAPTLRELARIVRRGGFDHEPSPPEKFREVMGALEIRFDETVFVDLGSGAGRVVLLASELPFREVIGVELSPALHARAEDNVRAGDASRRRAPIRLVAGDAASFALPADPLVLYIYNSFGARTMRQVLANVEASLAAHARPLTVVLMYCDRDTREIVTASAALRVARDAGGVVVLHGRLPARGLEELIDRREVLAAEAVRGREAQRLLRRG
jgi:SAM-dependent methyltransferase